MSGTTPPRRRRIAGERRRAEDAVVTEAPVSPQKAPEPSARDTAPPARPQAPEPPAPTEPTEPLVPVETQEPSAPRAPRKPVSRLVFAVSALVTTALVATALVLGLVTWDYREVQEADATAASGRAASAAAERAATAALAYSFETLDADLRSATSFMTPEFAETFTDTFETFVRPNAPEQSAVVTADVLATAVVNADEDRAQILVYVDQTTVSEANGGEPSIALNRTTFDMVKRDGSWLVDNFASY